MYLQQGDVLLKKKEFNLENPVAVDALIHKGENHQHRLRGEFRYDDKTGMLEVLSPSILYHEEHKDIKIPAGSYQKEIVKEYDHWLEESREVID